MRVANRQARQQRLQKFESLSAFANMGDTPEDWRKFSVCIGRSFFLRRRLA